MKDPSKILSNIISENSFAIKTDFNKIKKHVNLSTTERFLSPLKL